MANKILTGTEIDTPNLDNQERAAAEQWMREQGAIPSIQVEQPKEIKGDNDATRR